MAELFDGITTESKVYKGAGRVIFAPVGWVFPEEIADVIDPDTFVLASAWEDFGATTPDGITVSRNFEKDAGVEVDQMSTNILRGNVKNWTGKVTMTLLHSSLEMMKIAFEAADIDTGNGERTMDVGAPIAVSEQRLAVIQKHSKTGKLRIFAFRKASISAEEISLAFKADTATGIPLSFDVEPDLDIGEASTNMFRIIEQV